MKSSKIASVFFFSFLMILNLSCQNKSKNFTDLDVNKDEVLSIDELTPFPNHLIINADNNLDGKINKREFKRLLGFQKRNKREQSFIPKDCKIFKDISYVKNGHKRHKFDLYLPKNYTSKKALPLVIWIHGGGWRKLSKENFGRQTFLLNHGFAVASINYRLSIDAAFPAQIYDAKAAIRYIRKNAKEFNINPDKIGVWGSSAGGHLTSLLGVTNNLKEFEGDLDNLDTSSNVQAVCSWFGVSDITQVTITLKEKGDTKGTPNITKLLGGTAQEKKELAYKSSPVNYVTKNAPPFLQMHGDLDNIVPIEESITLNNLLKKAGVSSELIVVKGAKHAFFSEKKELNEVAKFFTKYLIEKE